MTWNTNEKAKRERDLPYNKVWLIGGEVNTRTERHTVNALKEMVKKGEKGWPRWLSRMSVVLLLTHAKRAVGSAVECSSSSGVYFHVIDARRPLA